MGCGHRERFVVLVLGKKERKKSKIIMIACEVERKGGCRDEEGWVGRSFLGLKTDARVCGSQSPQTSFRATPYFFQPRLGKFADKQTTPPRPGLAQTHLHSCQPTTSKQTHTTNNKSHLCCSKYDEMPKELDPTINEKSFILDALNQKLRIDGRDLDAFRELELSFGDDYGLADVRLGKTRYTHPLDYDPPQDRKSVV